MSGVSPVSALWPIQRLRFHAKLNPVRSELNCFEDDALISFVPMDAVGEFGGIRTDDTRSIADIGTGYTYFRDDDVVVAKITPCFENGKAALAKGLENGVALGTTELHVLRAKGSLDPHFLFYLVISHRFSKDGEAEMYGAGGQKRVPESFLSDFRFSVPPVARQRAIAAHLDRETAKIDTLIAKKRELIAKLKEQRSALISRTVTRGLPPEAAKAAGLDSNPPMKDSGVEWLGEVPVHWAVAPLGARYRVELGKMLDESRFKDASPLPYLRNVDVQWRSINFDDLPIMDIVEGEYERYTVQTGDIVVCEGGEVGRAAIVGVLSGRIGFQKALHRLRALKSGTEVPLWQLFVLRFMVTGRVFEVGGSSTIAHLTAEKFRKFKMPYPPRHEQEMVCRFLDSECAAFDRLIERIQTAITRLTEYRAALITAAVTGQLAIAPAR